MYDFLNVTEINLVQPEIDTSKWQRMFFDLEGSLDTKGDILQVAAITTDWDFNVTGVFNMYFKNKKPIGEKELKVHGITEEYLREHALGHFTEMVHLLPFATDRPTMFISYTTFDVRRINEELAYYNLPAFNFGKQKTSLESSLYDNSNCHLDAFQFGKKKAVVVAKELGEEVFEGIYRELSAFGNFDSKGNHDALYDSVLILALCRRFANERTSNTTDQR